MKAIILVLAAGVGKRCKEVSGQRPKRLSEIQGKTLLERTPIALLGRRPAGYPRGERESLLQ
jgi:choline kinase